MFAELLPRLLEIIYEINARFLGEVARRWPGDFERQKRMSIIEEGDEAMVRMAYLAIVGSFSINGVAALHSRLLVEGLFRDFYELWPDRFNNKTNGVTPRRWLAACNPQLATLISERIGEAWRTDLQRLDSLRKQCEDSDLQQRWHAVKRANKRLLAQLVERECGVLFDEDAMFDIQVKRIHEYKRQLLNTLHVIHLYSRIKRRRHRRLDAALRADRRQGGAGIRAWPRAIIKLISNVAKVSERRTRRRGSSAASLVFLPDYQVSRRWKSSARRRISPQQISTAGKEASGTGNMKFMMNGAITIGTLDGANIEILEQVGDENFFLFGLDAPSRSPRCAAIMSRTPSSKPTCGLAE